jgi:hypothetical protein
VPKLYDIELIKDNECVDSVNKSDKEGNTNQQQPAKEPSESNGRADADLSNSSGRGAVPNNLRSWGFEKKNQDTQKDAKK